MNRSTRLALLGGLVVVAVAAFLILRPGPQPNRPAYTSTGSPGASTPAARPRPAPVPVIRVRHGKPVGGVRKIEVRHGDTIRFRVVSDVADEIHVHGYDIKKDVPAGGSVAFAFPAKIEGGFVVEMESRGEQIAQLEVQP
jgi:FtsP/CotA-like multicopper oxidase with cupredoxin domain